MPIVDARYRRIETPELAGLVEHAWVVRDDGRPTREVLLPDGRGLLQVVVGAPGVRVDPLDGSRAADTSGVRGPMTRAVVREGSGSSVRVGLQLHPLAGARLGIVRGTAWSPVDALLGDGTQASVEALLAGGSDDAAVRLLLESVGALPRTSDEEIERLADVLQAIDDADGLVRASDLARGAGSTVTELFRWSVDLLGVPPTDYLAAVRFSAFVREAVGPGAVRPEDVVATLRWYVRAGYPPREVERFTGLEPAELRRWEEGVAALVGG